jgi:selenocysteine-specific elongation factor
MKHVIVGTAGHIDHGKSALVQALTGTDPDRWEEEKRRGITIDLGFAHLDLEGLRLGFVDVPGHERFVRNMLAGAGGIDLVALVIAADESIKPQTREHFDICRLLGIQRGLAVLTKADLVEPDVLELVRLETEEFLAGSFLEGAPIVAASARTGEGLDELRAALQEAAAEVPGKDSSHHFRLPVDRAFTMKGFGTVITGTLVSGSVGKDEEVEVFPSQQRLRVRGLQVHGQSVERALAGQRTAVNLAGGGTDNLERGMVLARPGLFAPTDRADVLLTLLPSARPLKHGARVHFHQGTAEILTEVRLLDRDKLEPDGEAYAQLRLAAPTLLLPGDRFIIRQFSPVITIGGGRVLSAQRRRWRRKDAKALAHLGTLAGGNRTKIVEAMVEREARGVLTEPQIVARTGWRAEELREVVAALVRAKKLRQLSDGPLAVASAARTEDLATKTVAALDAFHKKEPLLEGIPKEELKERLFGRVDDALFAVVLRELTRGGKVEVAGDKVKRAGRSVTLSREEEEARQVIEATKDVLAKVGVDAKRAQKIVQILLREGALVKVTEGLLFHRQALNELPPMLRDYKNQKGEELSVPAFKELTGVTRKYAIPLLEYLDRQRATRRAGDQRVILL